MDGAVIFAAIFLPIIGATVIGRRRRKISNINSTCVVLNHGV